MKKLLALLLAAALVLSLAACGASGTASTPPEDTPTPEPTSTPEPEETPEPTPTPTPEPTPTPKPERTWEPPEYVISGGSLKYLGCEPANEGLTDEKNVMIFYFGFNSTSADIVQFWEVFTIKFFQNGVQAKELNSYSSNGGEQYDLLGNYFIEVMNGGTLIVAMGAFINDDSPVTIMASDYNDYYGTNTWTVEVDPKTGAPLDADTPAADVPAADAETVEAALQGTWVHTASGGSFQFDAGSFVVNNAGAVLTGTYTVDTENAQIVGVILTSDNQQGTVRLPYEYTGDTLTVYNNNGEALVKQ